MTGRMLVQVAMPQSASMRYEGVGELVKSYGIYSLQLTTPSGDTFTFQLDRIQWAHAR